MRVKLPSLALYYFCKRMGVPGGTATITANAMLSDIGRISQAGSVSVVNSHMIRRQRERVRNNIAKQIRNNLSPIFRWLNR